MKGSQQCQRLILRVVLVGKPTDKRIAGVENPTNGRDSYENTATMERERLGSEGGGLQFNLEAQLLEPLHTPSLNSIPVAFIEVVCSQIRVFLAASDQVITNN